ncbi:MAG: DNA replication/repair protein RecF [Acidimicrobiales bacterium]|nr:DNA replication/repair protein RecF [Acidimicrobiales bacterium]
MQVDQLWLNDFRSYRDTELTLAPTTTAIVGANGEGKTNLVEALGFLATTSSFRGAPNDAMVRVGAEVAIVRAEARRDQRHLLIEAEISAPGRTRIQVNRQRLARAKDLLGALRVSVFSPDDLDLVKGAPAGRRRYLDDVLVALHPRNDQLRSDVDRTLKQRNALLRQAGGRLTDEVAATLDVWDERLGSAGDRLGAARVELVDAIAATLTRAYQVVAGVEIAVGVTYAPDWLDDGLRSALAASRDVDLRRGITTVGPHRDELQLSIGGLPARTHASQGEQRSLAFAMRMSAHTLVAEAVGAPPVLILDDVFSELDPHRSRALLDAIPIAQTVLTTAGTLPAGVVPEHRVLVEQGSLRSLD